MTFRQQKQISEQEKKDKRRGMTYSILFHLSLLLIVFFFGISSTDGVDDMVYIEVTYEEIETSSPESAPEAELSEAAEAAEQAPSEAEVEEDMPVEEPADRAEPTEQVEAVQAEVETPPADVETDLTTTDFSEILARERETPPEPDPVEEIVEETVEEVEEVEEEIKEEPQPKPTPTPSESERESQVENPRTRTSPQDLSRPSRSDRSGTSSEDGKGDSQASGTSDNPSSTSGASRTPNPRASGGAGGEDRSQWSGFQGTGPLQRKVTKYGPTKNLAGGPGVIMIRLCINRQGNIVYQEINKEGTTIKDTELLKRSMDHLSDYLFEEDQSAPYRECGNYTFRLTPHED